VTDFNPLYDPTHHQHVVCDSCGHEISLETAGEVEWSIYPVQCSSCGGYALESKFKLQNGLKCPVCKNGRLTISKRFAATRDMRSLFQSQGVQLWRFIGFSQVVKVE
jgi:predicted Zn-ribbon and HTH transcriptional regulator